MHQILVRGGIALGGVALAAVGALATAGPANAAYANCPGGALCAYLATNGSGTPGTVYEDNNNLLQYNKFNNAVSLSNNGDFCNVRIFSGLNKTGSSFVLYRGESQPDLGGSVFWKNVASNDWCV